MTLLERSEAQAPTCEPFSYVEDWSSFGHDVFGNVQFTLPGSVNSADIRVKWRIVSVTGIVLRDWEYRLYTITQTQNTTPFELLWDGYDMYGNYMPNGSYVVNMEAQIRTTTPYFSICDDKTYVRGFSISIS